MNKKLKDISFRSKINAVKASVIIKYNQVRRSGKTNSKSPHSEQEQTADGIK